MGDPDDILRRAYARLLALRDNLPDRSYLTEDYAQEFHGALSDLDCLGYDVGPFHLLTDSVRPSMVTVDGVVKSDSKEKYVERAMLLAKLDSILLYFQLSAPAATDEGNQEEGEHKEPSKIGFSAARKDD